MSKERLSELMTECQEDINTAVRTGQPLWEQTERSRMAGLLMTEHRLLSDLALRPGRQTAN